MLLSSSYSTDAHVGDDFKRSCSLKKKKTQVETADFPNDVGYPPPHRPEHTHT